MKQGRKVIGVILCVAIILGFYYMISNREPDMDQNHKKKSNIEILLDKDIKANYPKTPREVIKTYNQILDCLYNEKTTGREQDKLLDMEKQLLDEELLEKNSKDSLKEAFNDELSYYQGQNREMTVLAVSDTKDITYGTIEGRDMAYVNATYLLTQEKSYAKVVQEYALRKDAKGQWKIVAFRVVKGEEGSEEK